MSWHSDRVNSDRQEEICDKIDCLGESSEFQQNLKVLRNIPHFSKLPMEKLKLWAYLTYRTHFRKGEYLFRQGDDDGCAFYIIDGVAMLTHDDGSGEVDLRTYSNETFLGSITILGKKPRLYALKAIEDVHALVTEREKVKRLLEHFPELYLTIIQGNIETIYQWERSLLYHHAKDCKACASYLGLSVL